MKQKSTPIFQIMHVLTWIAFIALCFKAGALLVSYIILTFIDPQPAGKFYLTLDLVPLKNFNEFYFHVLASGIILLTIGQALLFYCTIKIFTELNLADPFHQKIAEQIRTISIYALIIGIFSNVLINFLKRIPVEYFPSNLDSYINKGDNTIYFAGIIYILYLVFKRGIHLQQESELTV